MSLTMNTMLFPKRELFAQLGTAIAALLIFAISQIVIIHPDTPAQEEPIALTIVAPPVAPEPVTPPPLQTIPTPPPEKTVERVQQVLPVAEIPSPVQQAAPPAAPVEKVEPVKQAPVVQQSNSIAEGQFAQDVRSRIERKKVYPDTARDLGMSGEVEILYELDRTGNLMRAEVATSSGYKLLDQAALRAVKSATFKGFPDDAWLGASSKVFRTKLVFSINQ
jgi:protein TonB